MGFQTGMHTAGPPTKSSATRPYPAFQARLRLMGSRLLVTLHPIVGGLALGLIALTVLEGLGLGSQASFWALCLHWLLELDPGVSKNSGYLIWGPYNKDPTM